MWVMDRACSGVSDLKKPKELSCKESISQVRHGTKFLNLLGALSKVDIWYKRG